MYNWFMKKSLIISSAVAIAVFLGLIIFMFLDPKKNTIIDPFIKKVEIKAFPLNKYSFDNLSKVKFSGNEIKIGEKIDEGNGFYSYMFYFYSEDPQDSNSLKRTSGLLTIPKKNGEFPILMQFRGYVDREIYSTGIGTKRSAEVYARNGFISLSPDFLGYGESDNPSDMPIEERFQTYTTALSLFASLENLNEAFEKAEIDISANTSKVAIWGHSNGGQIALSFLSITKVNLPTVLWAPVSKPFPYSILYFTDESHDEGKALRLVVANFEKEYDVLNFSPNKYYDRINSTIQVHHGTADDAVPIEWSNELIEKLDNLRVENEYYVYNGADHNLLGGWSTAITRSISFYKEMLRD